MEFLLPAVASQMLTSRNVGDAVIASALLMGVIIRHGYLRHLEDVEMEEIEGE